MCKHSVSVYFGASSLSRGHSMRTIWGLWCFQAIPKNVFATHHIKQDSLLITQSEPSPYRTFGTLPAVLMFC